MLNNIKPRAVLGFRASAEVYASLRTGRPLNRRRFQRELKVLKKRLGRGEQAHRRAVRILLKRWGLYREKRSRL